METFRVIQHLTIYLMRPGVLMMANIRTAAFWDVTLCSLVEGYQHFVGTDVFYPEYGGGRFL
jgi:hypothetical protein